ncbi:MAG: hypothetical protein IT285_00295 [Bdellovibrionales bacterium]|nr:hypothetical protein [Bdellovibrionales bacterium]
MPAARSTPEVLSCPAKLFLTGEYAALWGGPALVAAVPARGFGLELAPVSGSRHVHAFAPGSPAARLIERAGTLSEGRALEFRFRDPWAGRGGWGASTAQFLLARAALALAVAAPARAVETICFKSPSDGADCGENQTNCFSPASDLGMAEVLRAWREYRWCVSAQPRARFSEWVAAGAPTVPAAWLPSGADVCAQAAGGVIRFELDASGDARVERAGRASFESSGARLLMFSATGQAGRKVVTHEHLASLAGLGDPTQAPSPAARISVAARVCLTAWGAGPEAFGRAAGAFARTLAEQGLEHEAARADREAFERLPGVLGAKGCGALLADAFWVLARDEAAARAALELARERGLEPVSGLAP